MVHAIESVIRGGLGGVRSLQQLQASLNNHRLMNVQALNQSTTSKEVATSRPTESATPLNEMTISTGSVSNGILAGSATPNKNNTSARPH
jgi:hypothetical protein